MITVGGLVLLSLKSELNIWWLDVHFMARLLQSIFFAIVGLVLLGGGIFWGVRRNYPRVAVRVICAVCVFFALFNAVSYYRMLAAGDFTTLLPLPLRLLVAAFFVWLGWPVKNDVKTGWRAWASMAVSAAVLFGALPFGQMFLFGKTDYRRTADVAVVFGAGVDKNGVPSMALSDRMDTAIGLYKEKLVGKLILSGGPGPGHISETTAMQNYAFRKGVLPQDMIIDPEGLNTLKTVENSTKICKNDGYNTILAVSHCYHLPRVKMTYQKAGVEVYTVPARESRPLSRIVYFTFREAVAMWAYYLT